MTRLLRKVSSMFSHPHPLVSAVEYSALGL